jgi:hypothetical protein
MVPIVKCLWFRIMPARESLCHTFRSEPRRFRSAVIMVLAMALIALDTCYAGAQDGVLTAPRTLVKGERSATAAPLLFLYRERVDGVNRTIEGSDDIMALMVHLAFGVDDHMEARLKGELAEDVFHLGGELRRSLLSSRSLTVTVAGGSHAELFHTDFSPEWFNFLGVDATVTASSQASSALALLGAIDVALEFADVDLLRGGSAVHLDRFERVNLVPGFDYTLSETLHVVAEAAVPLNNRTFGYVAVGITRYWR